VSSPTSDAPRLLLLDGHSLAYRAFFALPVENFSTSTGQSTNAVYGFTSMLINLLRDEQPTHLAVAFDVSRNTFRTEEYAEYKAGRSATPEEFRGQVSLLHEVLAALRVPVVEKAGYEADDVIATLATQAQEHGMQVLICSGDRDTLQLVTPACTVLYPVKGVSELIRMVPDVVAAKYGVPPERYSDLAALVGEVSDNLPGVPGVGPKTAARWLAQYGDLSAIVTHVDQIKGKAGDSLRQHLDGVLRNRRLNALVRDLELPLGAADLARRQWDRDEVHQVFDGLEFRVLRERLFATVDAAEPEAESGFDLDITTLTSTDVGGWLAEHVLPGRRAGVQVVGSWGRGRGDARGIALAAADGAAGYLDLVDLAGPGEVAVAQWLADPDSPKAVHGGKGQGHALAARGLPLRGVVSDTALAAYLVRPDQRSYDLADLVLRHLGRELRLDGEKDSGQLTLDAVEGPDEQDGAMVQARAVLDLADALDGELDTRGGAGLLRDVELPLVQVLATMERVGVAVDDDRLAALEASFAEQVERARQEALAALPPSEDGAPRQLNLGSPKQLQVVLFDELAMPRTKRTKTGYTTDAEALIDLFARHPHPFLEALLRHRDVSRLRQTVEGLRKTVADDGRIHTTYHQTIAATGRLSSTDPNLQNIPIRTDEGRQIREAFIVGPGFESLMTADYSQIEMRIMAHLSGDQGLITAFRSGEDLHRYVGARVFDVDPADVSAAMRSKVKAMSYGLAYGLSAFGLSRQLRIEVDEARGLMDEYFERFGGVRDYLVSVVEAARRTGYTETMLGRRRYLPDLTSDNRQRREMAERMALNAPIQGSAADIIKVAMLRVAADLRDQGLRSVLLLQVHDELVLDVAPGERDPLERMVRAAMGGAAELSVPLDVSVGVGVSWESAGH
jgi:DNA polymerase I